MAIRKVAQQVQQAKTGAMIPKNRRGMGI